MEISINHEVLTPDAEIGFITRFDFLKNVYRVDTYERGEQEIPMSQVVLGDHPDEFEGPTTRET